MATEAPKTREVCLVVAVACAVLAPRAQADELAAAPGITAPTPRPPAPPPRLQVGVHGAMRVTVLDEGGTRFGDDALAYGWRSARANPLLGGSVDVSYLWAPIIDVGISAGWMTTSYAAGIDLDNDRMKVRSSTIAATARLHWMGGRPFVPEPRLDLGLLRERTIVHGTTATRSVRFLRAGIDWRLGLPTVGVSVAIGYTIVERAVDNPLAPPIGGLDLALGPYFRF